MRGQKVNLTVVFKGNEMIRIRSQVEPPGLNTGCFSGEAKKDACIFSFSFHVIS